MPRGINLLSIPLTIVLSSTAVGVNASDIEEVWVSGREVNLVGGSLSASQGLIGPKDIDVRPLLRTGEVLELVPGMVVTQHSGNGKANQYFLRGFNLDHGTDFATFVDYMPVNMRTHGHGQGYTDLNFLIPELIGSIAYKKGPYHADVGDFSGAGSASINTQNTRDKASLQLTAGEDHYRRLLFIDSSATGTGEWLYALETSRYDGPWTDINEDVKKYNAQLKYNQPLAGGQFTASLMAYDNRWNSADQIPQRAVDRGLIDELGSLDSSVGGESSRYSVSANWLNDHWTLASYAIRYDLNLWSNFTFFLDDETNGDQFEQVDKRWIYGGTAEYNIKRQLGRREMQNRYGIQWRYDDIDEVSLYKTVNRNRRGAVRSDAVDETSVGLYWESRLALSPSLSGVIGARYDYYRFEVDDRVGQNINAIDLSGNGGRASDGLASTKGSLIWTVSDSLEAYVSAGQGFHSNDARGTTVRIDPADGSAANRVDPLVRSLGGEIGARGFWRDRLNISAALWYLELDSELLFVGDAGNTEASRGSRRRGVEITGYYHISENWSLDLEYALSDAEFDERDPAGQEIPGAIEDVVQLGISAGNTRGLFGSLRLRYFGERPLEESGRINSEESLIANLRAGYHWQRATVIVDVLNVFDSTDHDIDYLYESRLASEPSGVSANDVHFHPFEPRTVRVSLSWSI